MESIVSFIFILLVASPIWYPLSYFFYHSWKIREWKKGEFPQHLKYNKHNLAEAYICLSTHFIVIDKFHQMNKIASLKRFFSLRLKFVPEEFDDIVDRNFHYPINPETVLDWVNKYANDSHKKLLAQFLVSLCHIDGAVNQKEYDGLRFVVQKLKLGIPFLESTIEMYRKGTTNNSGSSSSSSSGRIDSSQPIPSLQSKFAAILGVVENADETEIRKRYRQLAKKYHPDKFARESKDKQEQAHQRFIEIQEAYEYLLSHAKIKN